MTCSLLRTSDRGRSWCGRPRIASVIGLGTKQDRLNLVWLDHGMHLVRDLIAKHHNQLAAAGPLLHAQGTCAHTCRRSFRNRSPLSRGTCGSASVYATIANSLKNLSAGAVMQVFVSEQSGTDPTEKVNRGERLVHGVNGRHRADEHHRLPFKPDLQLSMRLVSSFASMGAITPVSLAHGGCSTASAECPSFAEHLRCASLVTV